MQLRNNVSLKPFTTFAVDAKASRLAVIETREDLRQLQGMLSGETLFLGNGSNVLFTRDFGGLVVMNRLHGVEELPAGPAGEYRFRAASGELWDTLVRTMTLAGHPGLENLVLIPGTVGGAAVQNIGAYGVEAAERIESVEFFDLDSGEFREFDLGQCDFGYRSSVFKRPEARRWFVTSVVFRLPAASAWQPAIAYKDLLAALGGRNPDALTVMHTVEALRRAKLPDPAEVGNAGSFFKNPVVPEAQARTLLEAYPSLVTYPLAGRRVKLAAGWLIDAAGLRGATEGGAGVWEKQALILVNRGEALGTDVKRLAERIIGAVEEKFSITLSPEVIIL